MSRSKARISGTRRSAAFKSLVTASVVLLLLTIGSAWSPVRAAGPALWIASTQQSGVTGSVGGVIEVRPIWLLKSGAPKQVKILEGAEPLANAAGVAFQPVGTLWVTTLNNTLLKFTPAQLNNLAKNPHPTPAATITSSAFGFILSCVFDSHVNLWIVDPLNNGVHEVSHAQLVAGTADITPAVTITDSTDLASPAFATFDKAGNLWISSEGNGKLVEFAANQLGTGGTPTPHVVISSSSLNAPGQLQFDKLGNLWVTNAGNSTVVEFTSAQLAASGSPAATVVLGDDGSGSLDVPWGLQFDSTGRLWVYNYGGATATTTTISKFAPVQLTASGSPTPRIFLTGLPPFAAQITFGPRY